MRSRTRASPHTVPMPTAAPAMPRWLRILILADVGAVNQRLDQHLAQPDGDRNGRDGQHGPLSLPVIRQATAMITLSTMAGMVVPG